MRASHGVAIVGLGAIGRRMLSNIPRVERLHVSGGWDLSAAARAAAARDFPGLALAEGAEALIADPASDIVYIGTPPASHGALARAAMAAGKAVFCEKPLGVDLADSRALARAMRASGLPQAVNLSLAAAGGVGTMRAALESGTLGEVAGLDIRLHFRRWPRAFQAGAHWLAGRAEGGFLREVGTHFLYLAETLFGPARLVDASTRFPDAEGAESHALARLDCAGVPVTLAGSVGGAGPDLVECTLWGTARSLRLTDFYRLWQSEGGPWAEARPEIANPAEEAYLAQLAELVRLMRGEAHLLPDFDAALSVQELVERILAARPSA